MSYLPGTNPGDEVAKIHQEAPANEMGLQRDRWSKLAPGSEFTVGGLVNDGKMVRLIPKSEPNSEFFVNRSWYNLRHFRGLPKDRGQHNPDFVEPDLSAFRR